MIRSKSAEETTPRETAGRIICVRFLSRILKEGVKPPAGRSLKLERKHQHQQRRQPEIRDCPQTPWQGW